MSLFTTWRKKVLATASFTVMLFSLIPSAVLAAPPNMSLTVSTNQINPSLGEKVYFDWNLISANAYISIYIYDKDPSDGGVVKRTIKSSTLYNSGHPSTQPAWDGKILEKVGNPPMDVLISAPTGTYTYYVLATNGLEAKTFKGTISVDYDNQPSVTTPQITNDYADPNSFDPAQGPARIIYDLNMDVDLVTVQILQGNNVIATLTNPNPGKNNGTNYAFWYGLKSNGQSYEEGTYNYQITATKYSGNNTYTDSETGTVTINYESVPNNTAPVITNVYANPNPFDTSQFSQNGYGTKFYFTLSKEGYVSIDIYNSSNSFVSSAASSTYRSGGENFVNWNGNDSSGNPLPSGTYTFQVKACSTTNLQNCNTKTGTVTIDGNTPTSNDLISNVYVTGSTFNPEDGEKSKVCFDVEKDNVDITVKVMKGSTTIVWLEDEESYDKGNYQCVSWNGEDEDGDIVSDGTYSFYVLAEKSGYNDEIVYKNVVVDTDGGGNYGDFISNIELNNDVFNPEDNEEAEICFDVNEDNVKVTIDILDEDNDRVVTLTNKEYDESNNRCISWDGEDDNSDIVDDGDYQFRIKATKSGDTQIEYEDVEVDTNGTSHNGNLIRNFEVNRRTFDPDNEKVQICFDIEKDNTDLYIEVRDDDGDRVKKILDNEYDETDNFCVTWNGRDDDDDKVSDGKYTIRVDAERGSEDQTETEKVTVDRNGGGNDYCEFNDLSTSSKYYQAFKWACEEGIFIGYTDGYMRPNQKITRLEATKVIMAKNDIEPYENDGSNAGYWDVERGSWGVGWLLAARQYGIHGNPDGSFRPNATVNNVELTRMAVELAEIDIQHCTYAPYNKNVWYNDYWCFAKENDLTETNTPGDLMTRGDVALMLYKLDRMGY